MGIPSRLESPFAFLILVHTLYSDGAVIRIIGAKRVWIDLCIPSFNLREKMPEDKSHYQLLDISDNDWLAFVQLQPSADIFHHPAWSQLISLCYGYRPFVFTVADNSGNILAGLPMMEVKSPLTGHRVTGLPFSDHCRPLYQDSEDLEQLTEQLEIFYTDRKIPRIEIKYPLPSRASIFPSSDSMLHLLTLDESTETTAGKISRRHWRNVKTAQKKGVRIERGCEQQHIREFYKLHLQTRQRQGVPIQPWKYFKLLVDSILKKDLGFVLLAYRDNQCLAGAVFLHWQKTLTYKYGASSSEGLKLRPNNLIFWTAIQWGCENGYTVFDMGKTENTNKGLCEFKKGWGAEETPLVYSAIAPEPPSGERGQLMILGEKLIKNTPQWVGRSIGEVLYKHYG